MKRSGFKVMSRLVGLVRPLAGYMLLAIVMGLIGHLCASFITVFGGYAVLQILHPEWSMSIGVIFAAVIVFALVRGFLDGAEECGGGLHRAGLRVGVPHPVLHLWREDHSRGAEKARDGKGGGRCMTKKPAAKKCVGGTVLNLALLLSLIVTLLVPITGVHIHKMASALFLLLCIVHTVAHRRKLGSKKLLLLAVVIVSFATGLFGMILDQYPIIPQLHKVISLAAVAVLAIHVFVYHRRLKKGN